MYASQVTFYLNGRKITLDSPAPDLLLIDYLRSPPIGLSGPKKPCGQGGCGGCTVILSSQTESKGPIRHRAINSCLRPVCALDGLSVTTIEGTGAARLPNPENPANTQIFSRSAPPFDQQPATLDPAASAARAKHADVLKGVATASENAKTPTLSTNTRVEIHPSEISHDGMNPVAYALAANNGSQCGYCSVGFVMNMSEFITTNPKATRRQIEQALDGNLCRCTGYRPILTGFKTLASDQTDKDKADRMRCLLDEEAASQIPAPNVRIPFPDNAVMHPRPVRIDAHGQSWETAVDLADLARIMRNNQDRSMRLVHANTSFGIYKPEYQAASLLVDIRTVPELHRPPSEDPERGLLTVPAGLAYTDFIRRLEKIMERRGDVETDAQGERFFKASTALGATHFMAMRTAGHIVRNAATIGGNLMLVLHHISKESGEPFPSDLATAMMGVGAAVHCMDTGAGDEYDALPLDVLVARVKAEPTLAARLVLISFTLPTDTPRAVFLPQKVALREVNSHSIVNATTRLVLSDSNVIEDAVLCFGGIVAHPWRAQATEDDLRGRELSLASAASVASLLLDEVNGALIDAEERMDGLPSEGISNAYRAQLAVSFFYKAIVNALSNTGGAVPSRVTSSGDVTWGRWPVSGGIQDWKPRGFSRPVGQPYVKHRAMEQAQGQLRYTHEIAVPPDTVNASLVQSGRALASFVLVDPKTRTEVNASWLRNF